MSILELEEKILAGLTGLQFEDETPCFHSVDPTYTLVPEGYPYASFEIENIGGVRFDSCHNERKYTFKLWVFRDFASLSGTAQEKREVARKQVAKIADRLILLYDKNEFLDGIVDNSEVVDFRFWTYEKTAWKDGAGYMLEATLNFDKLIFIKS